MAKASIALHPKNIGFEGLIKLTIVRCDNFSKQSENLYLLSKNTARLWDYYFSGILHILNHCRSRQWRLKKSHEHYKWRKFKQVIKMIYSIQEAL